MPVLKGTAGGVDVRSLQLIRVWLSDDVCFRLSRLYQWDSFSFSFFLCFFPSKCTLLLVRIMHIYINISIYINIYAVAVENALT